MSYGQATYCEACGAPLGVDDRACAECGTATPVEPTEYVDFFDDARPTGRSFDGEQIASWLRDRLGTLGAKRTAPGVPKFLMAVGGTLLGAGGALIAGSVVGDDGKTGTASVVAAVLLAGAVAAIAMAPRRLLPASVAASNVLAIALGTFVATNGDADSVFLGPTLVALILAALYFIGPSPGHSSHLAMLCTGVLLAGVALAGAEVFTDFDYEGMTTSIAVVAVVCAAAFGFVAVWVDRQGLKGMATPLLAVGIAALVLAVFTLFQKSDWGGSLAAIVAGLLLIGVANDRRRPGVLWWGAFAAVFGVVAFAVSVSPDDNGEVVAGIVAALGGAAFIGGAVPLTKTLDRWRRPDAQA